MFAAGFSQKEIFLSVLFYNIITAAVAVFFVLPCLYAIAKHWFEASCGIEYVVKHIFMPYMLPAELLMIGAMLCVVAFVTSGILHVLTPVQMLHSR